MSLGQFYERKISICVGPVTTIISNKIGLLGVEMMIMCNANSAKTNVYVLAVNWLIHASGSRISSEVHRAYYQREEVSR